jgi:phosphate-selective porin
VDKRSPSRILIGSLLALWLALPGLVRTAAAAAGASPQQVAAQTTADDDTADTDYVQPVTTTPARIPATGFVMPDLPDSWNRHTTYDGRLFSTIFAFVALVDYNAFSQDAASEEQVGEQRDEWDLRTMRLIFRGQLKFRHPVGYLVSVEVKGQDHVQNEASKFGLTDLEFSTSIGKLGTIKYGKIKEPFAYEMVGDAANLQEQERALNPFFASRGIGFRLTKPFADDSMTWSAGWYNDWWIADQTFKASGNNFAIRFTALPYWTDNGANYLHLGISGRRVGSDEGTLRFRGRPESNVTDYYVDSGTLDADHANELGLETLWGRGPFFVTADYARAWVVDAPASDDPRFWGAYVVVSYVLTGEHRAYDKKVAYSRRVLPQGKWGAWELVGRYSHVDLTDGLVEGGVFDRGTIGLNWWSTRRWKIGVDYGRIDLDRFGVTGVTHAVHTRLQWIY